MAAVEQPLVSTCQNIKHLVTYPIKATAMHARLTLKAAFNQ